MELNKISIALVLYMFFCVFLCSIRIQPVCVMLKEMLAQEQIKIKNASNRNRPRIAKSCNFSMLWFKLVLIFVVRL